MADSNRTEKATPQRRLKSRKQGRVTRSRELSGTAALIAAGGSAVLLGRHEICYWTRFFRMAVDSAVSGSIEANGPVLFWTNVEVLRCISPVLLCALFVSLGVGLAQGGFVFAPEGLAFKIDRISPVGRLKQIFSLTALGSSAKSFLPFCGIAWVGYRCIHREWGSILVSSFTQADSIISLLDRMLWEIFWKSCLILLLWGGMDYLLLWLKNEGELKMSRQEIREEMKDSDGNPANKTRFRKIQRQARRRQMIKAAEKATVVITNPTHYAVGLRYEPDMTAPVVVAKGLDLLASKIKQIASQRDIPIIENRSLARALYSGAEVGDAIPSALYHAVAEILVMVYRAQADVSQREAQRKGSAMAQTDEGSR